MFNKSKIYKHVCTIFFGKTLSSNTSQYTYFQFKLGYLDIGDIGHQQLVVERLFLPW